MRTSAGIYSEPVLKAACRFLMVAAALSLVISCGGRTGARTGYSGSAVVSWYGPGFHGKLTASGERYDMHAMTCAHKSLPFGTRLRLVNVENGREAEVVVNDRGPFVRGRDIDLSKAAAEKLGIIKNGTGVVRMRVLGRDMRYAKYLNGGKAAGATGTGKSTGLYTIQVAAFSDKFNAVHFKKGLELNHDRVYMAVKWIEGQRFYRVRVGRFRSEEQAGRYATRLADEGYDTRVVPFEEL